MKDFATSYDQRDWSYCATAHARVSNNIADNKKALELARKQNKTHLFDLYNKSIEFWSRQLVGYEQKFPQLKKPIV